MKSLINYNVGPTEPNSFYDEIAKQAITDKVSAMEHRSKEFQNLYEQTSCFLHEILDIPDTHRIYFVGSGTEAMHLSILNLADKFSGHIVQGAFSKRWYEVSGDQWREAEPYVVKDGTSPNLHEVSFKNNPDLLALTYNETSMGTSTMQDISILKRRFPNALICVDTVSESPLIKRNLADADYSFTSLQKAYCLDPGAAYIIVSEDAYERAVAMEKIRPIQGYHCITRLEKFRRKWQTPETPAVRQIWMLNKTLKYYLSVGKDVLFNTTLAKSKFLYSYFDNHSVYRPFVEDPTHRSQTTLCIDAQGVDGGGKRVYSELLTRGRISGKGYDYLGDTHFRIANFWSQTLEHQSALITDLSEIAEEFKKK
ncbi:MAG: aminotransferase class V-fold PLP-dependent enzyme [Candidatus Pacebacteria bacterium]|nr:aminotransferase class V-fold PLP-dependent enzyme [Candidatus Paceibacterota bacterium]